MTTHDFLPAAPYGADTYGTGAYGADRDPTTTDVHDWPLPQLGSEDYDISIDALIDELDLAVAERGPLSDRPAPGTTARIWLDTDGEPLTSVLFTVEVDGSWVVPDLPFEINDTTITHRDQAEEITAQWEFTAEITTDLDGTATYALNVESVPTAADALALGDDPAAEFNSARSRERITGDWTYTEGATFREGLDASNGTVFQLPRYEDE